MNDRINAGAAAITFCLVSGTWLVRWAVSPTPARGRHRARVLDDDTLLNELLGPSPEPAVGAAVTQAWRDCPVCDHATVGVVTDGGAWWCGDCLTPAGHITIHTTTGGAQ